jgi:hypothetical protein
MSTTARRGRRSYPLRDDSLASSLLRLLADGPRPAVQARDAMERGGWRDPGYLRQVKRRLGIVSYTDPSGAWWWRLPEPEEKA